MISILPLQRIMSSDDEVAKLEAQLQKAKAERAARVKDRIPRLFGFRVSDPTGLGFNLCVVPAL